jgi:hypothetical protein
MSQHDRIITAMSSRTDEQYYVDESVALATDTISAELQEQLVEAVKEKVEAVSQPAQQQLKEAKGCQDDPPTELQMHNFQSAGEEYSVLTVTQKRLVVMTASLASLFSPMATAIYC